MSDRCEVPVELRGVSDPDDAGLSDIYVAGHPLGHLFDKLLRENKEMKQRLNALEVGEVDATDVVVNGSAHQLPIQIELAKRQNGQPVKPTNLKRATHVWQEFTDRAVADQGYLKLTSAQVRNVLESIDAPSGRKTARRVMDQLARHSGPEDDEQADVNLLSVRNTGQGLALVADRDEWREWVEALESDLGPSDDAVETTVEDTGSESAAIEDEMDQLLGAEAVRNDSQDTVSTEVRPDGSG